MQQMLKEHKANAESYAGSSYLIFGRCQNHRNSHMLLLAEPFQQPNIWHFYSEIDLCVLVGIAATQIRCTEMCFFGD